VGWETLIFAGLSVAQSRSQMSAAKKQANQVVAEGNLKAAEKAKELRYRTARVTNSFLNSGVTLEGSPMAALMGISDTGIDDINLFNAGVQTKAKGIISSARSKAIGDLIGTVAGSSFGDSFGDIGGFGSDVKAGFDSYMGGTGFGTGYDVSNTVRNNPSIF